MPLINGVIDIVEGHVLIGCSRLIGALLLILCIAVGLSATLMIVKKQFAMIAVDILFDGLRFAAVAAIGFGGDFRSSGAGISYIALLAAVGHALAFLPDELCGDRHRYGFALCCRRHRFPGSLWLGRVFVVR